MLCTLTFYLAVYIHVYYTVIVGRASEFIPIIRDPDNQGSDNRGSTVYNYNYITTAKSLSRLGGTR